MFYIVQPPYSPLFITYCCCNEIKYGIFFAIILKQAVRKNPFMVLHIHLRFFGVLKIRPFAMLR